LRLLPGSRYHEWVWVLARNDARRLKPGHGGRDL
jgi:hypothetical protein